MIASMNLYIWLVMVARCSSFVAKTTFEGAGERGKGERRVTISQLCTILMLLHATHLGPRWTYYPALLNNKTSTPKECVRLGVFAHDRGILTKTCDVRSLTLSKLAHSAVTM